MQLRNNIKLVTYIILTSISYLTALYNIQNILVISLFYLGIVLNQYFLYKYCLFFLGVTENKGKIPTFLYGLMKLVILVISFVFAMQSVKNIELFLIFIYIFQLIILVLSIKTDILKIKETK